MKTTYQLYAILLTSGLFYASCSPVLYSTIGQNVPMFTAKGEASLQAGYGASFGIDTDADGVALQAGYAVSDHVAFIGSYYSMKGKNEQGYLGSAPSEWNSKGSYLEFGAGKYGTLKSNPFAWEVFAGMGTGTIKNEMVNDYINVKILKPFMQPSFGYISNYVDIIFTPRLGLVSFTSHATNSSDPQQSQQTDDFFKKNKNTFVFEPGITLRGGYQNMKVQLQYNYSTFKTDLQNNETTLANNEYFSIGVHYLISGRYKKNTE